MRLVKIKEGANSCLPLLLLMFMLTNFCPPIKLFLLVPPSIYTLGQRWDYLEEWLISENVQPIRLLFHLVFHIPCLQQSKYAAAFLQPSVDYSVEHL